MQHTQPNTPLRIHSITSPHAHAPFTHTIHLTITLEALSPLTQPVAWKIIYVPSPQDEKYDQTLEEFQIGAISEESLLQFQVECDAPKAEQIARQDLTNVSALIITSSYRQQEFLRIGYFVQNQLHKSVLPEQAASMSKVQLASHITRTILLEKPRITNSKINWMDNSKKQANLEYSYNQAKMQNSLGTLGSEKSNSSECKRSKRKVIVDDKKSGMQQKKREKGMLKNKGKGGYVKCVK